MRRYLFLSVLFIIFTNSWALENQYSVRGVYGWATSKDLGEVVFGQIDPDHKQYKVYSLDAGRLLYANVNDWPLDIYAKGGVSYYNEDNFDNCYGVDAYIKAFWNFDVSDNRVRLGLGEGLSYTTKTLKIEELDAQLKDSPTSKFLNYLDISLDFDIGKLVRSKELEELYFGVLLKHRSGIFGTFNNVHGGSNYNAFYLEKNF